MINNYYSDEENVQIILALLKKHSIKKIIASPGSTNLSFVISLQNDPYFEMYSAVDERSAAYMACGLAYESNEPVVLSCTGATASRNYFPGLTEAYYRKLPVLCINSSQVISNIGHNNAQAIDSRFMLPDTANLSLQLPIVKDKVDFVDCEVKVNQAILELNRHGGGPVHLFLPTIHSNTFNVKQLPEVRKIERFFTHSEFPKLPSGKIAVFIGAHKEMDNSLQNAIDDFCASNDAVVLCDHTSSYKGKYRLLSSIAGSQNLVENEIKPDLLIHIGEITGDYSILKLIPNKIWRVSEDGDIKDTYKKLNKVFEMTEKFFFQKYAIQKDKVKKTYYTSFKNYIENINAQLPEVPFSNIWTASKLSKIMPKNSVIHFGILNSLRSWNFFEIDSSIKTTCNVGGFGIDGNMSSLIGASLLNPQKLYFLILGDLSFFYDMNSLGNIHVSNNVRFLMVNNGKGTEFKHYNCPAGPLEDKADKFVSATGHYGNKSAVLVKNYVESLGFTYLSASNKEEFTSCYESFANPKITDKPIVFEIFTDSKDESDALRNMISIKQSNSGQIKKMAKQVIGKKGISSIKNLLK